MSNCIYSCPLKYIFICNCSQKCYAVDQPIRFLVQYISSDEETSFILLNAHGVLEEASSSQIVSKEEISMFSKTLMLEFLLRRRNVNCQETF